MLVNEVQLVTINVKAESAHWHFWQSPISVRSAINFIIVSIGCKGFFMWHSMEDWYFKTCNSDIVVSKYKILTGNETVALVAASFE